MTSEKKSKTENFQNFSPYKECSKIYVSDQLLCDFQKEKLKHIYKYLPIDYFIDSIIHHYFYMASPSKWEDSFEMKYLDFIASNENKENEELRNYSIFCSCMTYNNSDSEEASWNNYGDNKENVIRVTYNFDEFCKVLNDVSNEKIYIGKVDYKLRKDIVKPLPQIRNEKVKNGYEVLYVNNFCLKQNAYEYEKELRFCVVKECDSSKEELRIEYVNLLSAIEQITLPPINFSKIEKGEVYKKVIEQAKKHIILKTFCPKVPIHVSNLFNPNEPNMTSELIL